jgi:Na+-driven multidrug efflux pump
MEKRSPTAELLRLALPMIGMMVSRQLVNFIDTFMVSMLGTSAQAAIAPSTILLFTISCLGMGIAQSIQTFVSQADGAARRTSPARTPGRRSTWA